MEVRLSDGAIHKARITGDNKRHKWELRVLNEDGGPKLSAWSREDIILAGIQIVQTTNLEWENLCRAGFQPPFKD